MTRERRIQADILLDLGSRPDIRLWRNNVGLAVYPDGARVAYGLAPGSADLIGIKTVTITPDMVGQTLGLFVSLETKRSDGGRRGPGQDHWAAQITDRGGIAGFARSLADATAILDGGLGGLPLLRTRAVRS